MGMVLDLDSIRGGTIMSKAFADGVIVADMIDFCRTLEIDKTGVKDWIGILLSTLWMKLNKIHNRVGDFEMIWIRSKS